MSKKRERGRSWNQTDQIDRINEGKRHQAERVQALLAKRESAQVLTRLSRPGISTATTVQYALTSAPTDWALADRGRARRQVVADDHRGIVVLEQLLQSAQR